MNGDGEKDEAEIVEEITRAGLSPNLRAEVFAEEEAELKLVAARKYAAEAEPLGDAAGLVYGVEEPIGVIVTPPVCGQNYAAGGRVFPDKCSLPAGHKPKSSTANHFCFGIGWWA